MKLYPPESRGTDFTLWVTPDRSRFVKVQRMPTRVWRLVWGPAKDDGVPDASADWDAEWLDTREEAESFARELLTIINLGEAQQ